MPRCICTSVELRAMARPRFANGRHLLKCGSCGLEQLWPRPVKGNSDNSLYSNPDYLSDIDEREHYGYFRALYDSSLADILRPESRILDFGAGSCLYQKFLHQLGHGDVCSLEINPHLARMARQRLNPSSIFGSMEELEGAHFDVVLSNQVLEHVFDPWDLVHRCIGRLLQPGGYFVFSVPNAASLNRTVLAGRWIGWSPAEHIWFFDATSASKVFGASAEFQVAKVQVASAVNSRFDGFRPSSFAKRLYYSTAMRLFERLGRGDQLIVTLRKRGLREGQLAPESR